MYRLSIFLLTFVLVSVAHTQTPDWSVDPADFSSTMSVVGALSIDGVPAMGENDLVAAFVGEEVRGVNMPIESGGQYLFILTIHADMGGETVSLKAYLADRDIVVDIGEMLTFEVNGVVGTPANPLEWTATRGTGPCASPPPDWTIDTAGFSSNMSVIAEVVMEEGRVPHQEDVLAAFAGEELRGVSASQDVSGAQLFFLTVYGNVDGEELSFKFYDARARAVLLVAEDLSFGANEIVGIVADPLNMNAGCNLESTSIEIENPIGAFFLRPAYPNPFRHETTISYEMQASAWVEVAIYDLLGRKRDQLVEAQQAPGIHTVRWMPKALPQGLYLYRVQVGGKSTTGRLSFLK